jgi:hypothetical protein
MTTLTSAVGAARGANRWLLVYTLLKTLLIIGLVLLFRGDVEQNVLYMAF